MIRVAVQGCGHGELDKIYKQVQRLEEANQYKVDLLVVCGDFQAIRNESDLSSMSCPEQFRRMGDFRAYYTGKKTPPVLTLFVGGNHEAVVHQAGLYCGGWAAPNIFFLGYSGCFRFGSLRIGGISGIYDERDHNAGYFERFPFSPDSRDINSVYHTRSFEEAKLLELKRTHPPLDFFFSHDWPLGIWEFGDKLELLRKKPFLETDMHNGKLGSPGLRLLLNQLKPKFWCSGHMHVEFEGCVPHDDATRTQFHAMSKCYPRRTDHLRVFEVPGSAEGGLSFDVDWLAVLRCTSDAVPLGQRITKPYTPISDEVLGREKRLIQEKLGTNLSVPENQEQYERLLVETLGISTVRLTQ